MSEIQKGSNKFFVGQNENEPEAEIVFSQEQNKMVIEHTFVSEKLRGQGVGQELVDEAARHARESDIKIESQCPYAKEVLEKNEKYQDVLA